MKHPLLLVIHAPLREKRDFRQTLVGLKHALCVSVDGTICTYDLLPSLKPRKGQEHQILPTLAAQLKQGWTICVWDADRFLLELKQIVDGVRIDRPALRAPVDEAWKAISDADDEQLIDMRTFEKLPNGHYVAVIAARENFDYDAQPPRSRRRLLAYRPKARPVSEDFWGVLHSLIMSKSEAAHAWATYGRWVATNRPRPPRLDVVAD